MALGATWIQFSIITADYTLNCSLVEKLKSIVMLFQPISYLPVLVNRQMGKLRSVDCQTIIQVSISNHTSADVTSNYLMRPAVWPSCQIGTSATQIADCNRRVDGPVHPSSTHGNQLLHTSDFVRFPTVPKTFTRCHVVDVILDAPNISRRSSSFFQAQNIGSGK